MSEPKYTRAFPSARRKPMRWWLFVLLAILTATIAITVALWFGRFSGAPVAPPVSSTASETPTHMHTPSSPASPIPTPTATETVPTPPAPVDSSLATFREQTRPWLDDATTGIEFASMTEGAESVAAVDQLIRDTQLMSDARAPSSVAEEWRIAVGEYATQINGLRVAKSNDEPAADALASTRSALEKLRLLVGL